MDKISHRRTNARTGNEPEREPEKELFANDDAKYAELQVDAWVHQPGLPSNSPRPKSARFEQVDSQMAAFAKGIPAWCLETEGWSTNEWRRYLLRPVYVTLAETPEGLEFARRVYAKARPGYHSLTQQGIDPVLKWDEVAAETPDDTQ